MPRPRHTTCSCSECAELDLQYPGEGRQLALLPSTPAPGRERSTDRIQP